MQNNYDLKGCEINIKKRQGQIIKLNNSRVKLGEIPQDALFLFLAMGISLLGDSSLYILLPIYAQDIGIPIALVGILLSINRFIRLGTNQFVRHLYSKMGGDRLFHISIVLAGVTTLLYGLPVGFAAFIIARAVWGGCWSAMRLVCFIKIAEKSSDNTRGALTGIFNSVIRFGSLAATLLSGIIVELVGYRNTYYIFAIITLTICVYLTTLSIRKCNSKTYKPKIDPKVDVSGRNERSSNKNSKSNVGLESVYNLSFLNAWISSGLLSTTIGYVLMIRFGNSISFFDVSIGVAMITGFLSSLRWIYSIFLPVFFGRISDRYGRLTLVVITCIVQVLSLIAIAYAQSFFAIFLAIAFAFAGATVLANVLDILAVDHHCLGEKKNILGHFMTCGDLGSAFGAIAGYSLAIALGYNNIYLVSALALAIALGFTKCGTEAYTRDL